MTSLATAPRLIGTGKVAKATGLSKATIIAQAKLGKLEHYRISGRWLFDESEVVRFVEQSRCPAA